MAKLLGKRLVDHWRPQYGVSACSSADTMSDVVTRLEGDHVAVSLHIAGGRVIDPAHGCDEIRDIVIDGGRISEADSVSDYERIDAAGLWVIPGLVDLHVHIASGPNAQFGHEMLARAGVTTGLDLGGPIDAVLRTAAAHGAGLTYAAIDLLGGGGDRSGVAFSRPQVRDAYGAARKAGGIGLKVHADTPVTPETIDHAIGDAAETGSWIAVHCGSTETASDLTGLRETIGIAAGRAVHVAHVNSYCRGALAEPRWEAEEAIELLSSAPVVFGESYLSPWNGNSGACRDGRPEVARVARWLERFGHAPTEQGLEDAIRAGSAAVVAPLDDALGYIVGDVGVAAWRAAGTRTAIGFPLNPFDSRVRLATASVDARFVVSALATDGGANPRNVTIEAGLALVALGGLTPAQFVEKASTSGARALGLTNKGHLGIGADADLAIVDPLTRRVVTTIAEGVIVMDGGRILGHGTRVLTTTEGIAAVEAAGCTPIPFDPAASGLRTGSRRVAVD